MITFLSRLSVCLSVGAVSRGTSFTTHSSSSSSLLRFHRPQPSCDYDGPHGNRNTTRGEWYSFCLCVPVHHPSSHVCSSLSWQCEILLLFCFLRCTVHGIAHTHTVVSSFVLTIPSTSADNLSHQKVLSFSNQNAMIGSLFVNTNDAIFGIPSGI